MNREIWDFFVRFRSRIQESYDQTAQATWYFAKPRKSRKILNEMPRVARFFPGFWEKESAIAHMLQPSDLIMDKLSNTFQKERVEGLVLAIHGNHVVRWGSPETNAFIMMYADPPRKELYATHRMVWIIE